MKFFKFSAIAIMVASLALFACSEQGDQQGSAQNQQESGQDQSRGYFGDKDRQEGVNPQNQPSPSPSPQGMDSSQQPPAGTGQQQNQD